MTDVLVVEDNAVNRKLIGLILGKSGYSFTCVDNGTRALELLAYERFKVVLMDMMMPVMNGYEATRRIRADANLGPIPVIALTANALHGEEERCRDAGCDDYISKPYTKERLLAAVAAAMKKGVGVRG